MKITNREKEIIQLVAEELTTKEIAAQLYISNETVTTHRRNLMDKLKAKNAAGLIRRGFESGLLRVAMIVLILIQFHCIVHAQELPIALETDTSHAVRFGMPIDQSGNKFYWDPQRSALLVGTGSFLFANTWNLDDIGNFSSSFGSLNIPNGGHSMSWGQANNVQVDFGTAWGKNNFAKGYASTVLGEGNLAKGYGSLVLGVYNDTIPDMADQQVFSENTPLLVVGNGTTNSTRSNAFAVYGNGFVKIGKGHAPLADLHIRQSDNLEEGGNGGLLLEARSDNLILPHHASWRIQAYSQLFVDKTLNFSLNGERVSYIDDLGNYIKVEEDFTPQNKPMTKAIRNAASDISNIRIGKKTLSKNNEKVVLNTASILEFFPDIIVYDKNEKPFGIDYSQLYLTAIVALQEEIKVNLQQKAVIDRNQRSIAHLTDQLSELERFINK